MSKSETFVSVVLITDNQAVLISAYIKKLGVYLKERYSDYETVIIDQCSTDNTDSELGDLLSSQQSVRYIKLAQPVSYDVALAAGIENAIGDFVINLNIAFDECNLVAQFVNEGKAGHDIVIGISNQVNSRLYKCIRALSSRLIHSIGYTLPSNSTGSLCLSRRAVNSITESGRYYCKLYIRMANIGYPIRALQYDESITNIPKKTIANGIQETLHHMVFNSTKPLRWMSMLGGIGCALAMVFSSYSLIVNIINDQVAEGWTTTILFMSFLFAILFTMLSFFGEYLARLLNDRSEHKEYGVLYEKNSSVMLEENRHNVHFSSLSDELNLTQTLRGG